jgi:hypothetical protein
MRKRGLPLRLSCPPAPEDIVNNNSATSPGTSLPSARASSPSSVTRKPNTLAATSSGSNKRVRDADTERGGVYYSVLILHCIFFLFEETTIR